MNGGELNFGISESNIKLRGDFFLLSYLVVRFQIMYTLVAIDVDIYNESAWNYLRGITQTLDSIANYSLPEPYCRFVNSGASITAHIVMPFIVS